jgi:hypothetical protein
MAVLRHDHEPGIGYVRLLGYGLHWKDTRRHPLLWSERERIYRQLRFGPWLLTPLKPGARGVRRRAL